MGAQSRIAGASVLSGASRLGMRLNQGGSRLSDGSLALSQADAESINQYINKEISKNKAGFDLQVKNLKPIIMQEAVEFIKEQA